MSYKQLVFKLVNPCLLKGGYHHPTDFFCRIKTHIEIDLDYEAIVSTSFVVIFMGIFWSSCTLKDGGRVSHYYLSVGEVLNYILIYALSGFEFAKASMATACIFGDLALMPLDPLQASRYSLPLIGFGDLMLFYPVVQVPTAPNFQSME